MTDDAVTQPPAGAPSLKADPLKPSIALLAKLRAPHGTEGRDHG